ncbi:MgtC/SapB family protein [Deinococcus maricopensis]|uniref:MgtC/SapB transporter n=1 Tax=Deinococcus maricopensis (strain DSM 21211 / LMG 22137 / NRRL B-23946 / LB-34) TaxID=709986 RepID=E8U7K0_DEIML|nr:MgtC/SapB family protein [Deinococcus maricopensis]ADV67039.1 MgtC/SapB transporter [Deinococcus maricopensis DSM 21211]
MADPLQDLLLLVRLLVAGALSALIGWERETKNMPAGLRTHLLVGMSAALFVVLGETLITRYANDAHNVRFDVIGVLGAVVSGVSFLGAGAIFSARGSTHGLTTAASLLATAAIGATCGLTHYVLAGATTLLFLLTLNVLATLKTRLLGQADPRNPR